jgi:two-component system response regulator PilR (NtrC family)
MQTKLMRALQENEIRPLGSNKSRKINLRIISASSASLRELMSAGKFREDLFYRLYVYPIKVPSLSERSADIPLLADYFLKKVAQQQGKKTAGFAPQLIEFIKSRAWEGNIRELENFVERVVAVMPPEAPTIESDILPVDLKEEFTLFLQSNDLSSPQKSLKTRLRDCEAQILREVLEETQWNQTRAAKVLDTTEQLIRYRMKKLGIKRPE